MESTISGASLAAQPGHSNDKVSGIRAPLTVDESDSNVNSDYSGSEFEDYESGEDMSGTAGVVKEDEEIVEKTDVVEKLSISEGGMSGLNGESIEGSSSNERGIVRGSESAVFKPFSRTQQGIKVGHLVDSDDSGWFLSGSSDDEPAEDEKYVATYSNSRSEVGDEVSKEEPTRVISIRAPSARKLSIPIAKISGESDGDSSGSEVLDDKGLLGILGVPRIKGLHRINSVPKVKVMEADEEDDKDVSQAEDVMEMELDENLPASGMDSSLLDDKEPIVVENSLLQEETVANMLAANDESNPTSESLQNADLIHLDEEIKEVDVVDYSKEFLELADHREPADITDSIVLSNISDVASVAESEILCDKLAIAEVDELGSNNYTGAASLGNTDSTSRDIFHLNSVSENVESIKQEIDQTVADRLCVDVKEVPAEARLESPEIPEAIIDSMPECMSDSLFQDASQSVFEGSELVQETLKEDETRNLLPGEVEESSFDSDNKAVTAEMDMVQDSAITQNGRISLVHSQDIDGQVVEDFDDDANKDGGRNGIAPSADDPFQVNGEENEALSEREKEKIKKIQRIQLKYLHLLDRLGRSPQDNVASKVLYQLTLAVGSSYSQAFHLDCIKIAAMELESHKNDDVDLSLSILIIGKTGVGKSATINSIFGETAAAVDAFEPATTRVKEVVGLINGVKLKVFDTPGLRTSSTDQSINRKVLSSIKKLMKKSPPDVILYVDRLDTQILNDLPLMRLVTSCLGSSIWRKSVIAFTHGTLLPPDGPNGHPLSYEAFVVQQSQIIQRLISHSSGEPAAYNSGLTVPVCVIENHPLTEKNGRGETLLHNGESWRSHLLLLCCSMKILSELSSLEINQSPLDYGRPVDLSSLFLSSVHPELPNDQRGDVAGSAQEEDIESDNLPLLKLLTSSQMAKLSRNQREAYFEDDYCTKILQKDLREEIRQIRCLSGLRDKGVSDQETEAEMALPPFFDVDDTCFKFHASEPYSRLLTRHVVNYQRWDHNCSYNGLQLSEKEFIIQLYSSVSAKHGEELTYTIKGKTKIKNLRKNQTTAGVSITFVGENLVPGLKAGDRIAIGKQILLVGNASILQSQDDAAYGVNFGLFGRNKDHHINQDETSVGMSVMRYRDGLVCGCNLHSQISISRTSKVDITAALNNRLRGQISVKMSSCDQLQIAALALVPIAGTLVKKLFGKSIE